MWSDCCDSQFRSRFVFQLLKSYLKDLTIEWNFNEAHHGKGFMDGIGGSNKNMVFRQLRSGKPIVNSPKEFCDAAYRFVPSIFVIFRKEKNLLCKPEEHWSPWFLPLIILIPFIPSALKLQKPVQSKISDGVVKIDFLRKNLFLFKWKRTVFYVIIFVN